MIKILPLNKFRRLKEFSKVFKINEDTVIAYDGNIYANKILYPDVLEHEKVHLKQQKEHGLLNFTDKYINNRAFRLQMEAEAYKVQLESIDDLELREAVRKDIIIGLMSGLYGKMSKKEAEKLLPKEPKKLDVNKLV